MNKATGFAWAFPSASRTDFLRRKTELSAHTPLGATFKWNRLTIMSRAPLHPLSMHLNVLFPLGPFSQLYQSPVQRAATLHPTLLPTSAYLLNEHEIDTASLSFFSSKHAAHSNTDILLIWRMIRINMIRTNKWDITWVSIHSKAVSAHTQCLSCHAQ